jgi:hypothetical protein
MSKVVALHVLILAACGFAYVQGCDSNSGGSLDQGDGGVSVEGGSGEGGPASLGMEAAAGDGRNFCQRTYGHVVDTLHGCCSDGDKDTGDYKIADGLFSALAPVCVDTLESSIAKKRVLLHRAEAESCFAAYAEHFGTGDKCRTLTTTYSDPAGSDCRNSFTGVQAVGAPCAGDHECLQGLTCIGYTPTSDGTCQTPPAAGAACGPARGEGGSIRFSSLEFGSHPGCATGAYCNEGKCVGQAADGQACERADSEEANPCAGTEVCVMGKCAAVRSAVNGPCASNEDCEGALHCAKIKGQSSGTCQTLKPAGGTCTGGYGFATECVGRCNAAAGADGVCASFCGSM